MSRPNQRHEHERMQPHDPTSFHHRRLNVNGLNLHFVDEGSHLNVPNQKTCILVHGYPDCWYGWRFQIPELVKNGYRVIVPDLRGYGTSQGPYCTESSLESVKRSYAKKNVCQDLVQLMDALKIASAIFIGHDWGGYIVWRMPLYHPNRVSAVISLATNFSPPATQWIEGKDMVKLAPLMAYQEFFATDRADAALNADVELSLRVLLRSGGLKPHNPFSRPLPFFEEMPKDLPPADMSEMEFKYYTYTYCQSTFNGPLQWYRTRRFDYEDEQGLPARITQHPCLYLFFGKDPVFKKSVLEEMPKLVDNLDIKIIQNAAHWGATQEDTRQEVSQSIVEWLNQKFGSKM